MPTALTLTRALGAATAAYSIAITVKPAWLAKPCGLTTAEGAVPDDTALLIRAIGARDTAIGTAMLLATRPHAARTAVACRIAADWSDAVLFGALLSDPTKRQKIAGFAAGWGALCAAAAARLPR
ncbi:hypothetical protein ACFTXJ_15280 [Streptomyces zhihengii]|uniref:hypothetical protein n=1 Tax=Streptomyces zhihengii TaxID=1818004 RepID=UPI003645DB18